MICKFCGNVIEDNSDYCFICGQKVVTEAPAYAAQVYSQKSEGAPAEMPVSAAPAEPVVPVYAAPVVPEMCKNCKKAKKKAKAPADPSILSMRDKVLVGLFAALFLAVAGVMCSNLIVVAACVVLTAIVAFVCYKNYNKAIAAGYEEKAVDLLNTGMIGLCVGMGVLVVGMLINFVF